MSKIFVVNRAAGEGWDNAKKLTEQDDWEGHAKAMDALYEAGFVVLAGPIKTPTFQALMVVRGESEEEVVARFADDPWIKKDISRIVGVVQWGLRVGGDRLAPAPA